MALLRDLLKAMLVIILGASATLMMVLQAASEQSPPAQKLEDNLCPAPQGWSAHLVEMGESLTILGEIVGVTPAELVIANCLQGDLHPGDTIYLPPPSLGQTTCGPPTDWVLYEIQPGDSLPLLAERFSIPEGLLWHANCMSESMTFLPGFRIYIPPDTDLP